MKKKEEDYEEDLQDEATDTDVGGTDRTSVTDVKDLSDEEEFEEDEAVDEDKSLVGKLKKSLAKLNQKGDRKTATAGKDKKSSKIVIICLVIIMAVVLLPDFFSETPETQPNPASMLKPRPKKKKPVAKTETTPTDATAPTDTPATEATVTEPTPADPTTTTEAAPLEPTPEDTTTSIGETPDATSSETPTGETTTITGEDSPVDVTTTETSPPVSEVTTTPETSSPDTIDGELTTGTDDNLTDQILKDLEGQVKDSKPENEKKDYVAPPDYDYRGRGLVYNCAGKHWACVDGPSYKTCEDNAGGNKFLKKRTECYPFNVYQTAADCTKMQNRMVSSSAKTQFCNE